ncbi:MAG: choice-of-anchor L domain-containing protein [Crocinitomicaceae bacterium]|nr:choice-of-anchor L domain-containing protein [Crocinitomicaceae bacterium]MBK8926525.1 choice-of-anchor L domain-containing protein [Crocinitomicaceae bacterium]
MKKRNLVLASAFLFSSWTSMAQSITIDQTMTPAELVNNVLVGAGVVVSNVEFNYSAPLANAVQTQVAYFTAGTSSFPISEGVIMGTGNMIMALGPNTSPSMTDNSGVAPDPNDPDLDAISTAVMNNEAVLEFDFIPSGDSVVFEYIFASEEYPEYSPSSFNDAFGFFISGPGFSGTYTGGAVNIALLPSPVIPVTINNVNPTTNATYYVSNAGGTSTQFDGYTVTLTAAAQVQCGETYHIKLAIADAGDQAYESAVFLKASSFSSNGVQVEIASATGSAAITEACDSAIVSFIRPSDQTSTILTISYGIGGTATNGVDYPGLSGSVTFPIGEDTVQFYVTPNADGLTEGTETVILSVSIVNECGDTITTDAIIEIVDPIPFNVVPADVTIDCPTATVDISASPDDGVPAFTYDWGIYGTGTTASVPGDIVGTTNYNVEITDACGTTATGVVAVTLAPAPEPTITFNQNTFTICPNDDATIIATVNNPYSGTITYDWAPDPGTTNTITVSPNALTWYYLTINDGCYDVTDSVKVEIGNIDLTNIVVTDATNCPGLLGLPGSVEVFPDDPTFTYQLTGGGDVFGPQTSNLFSNLDGGIIYFLHVEDADGCSIDTTVEVTLGSNAVLATWMPGSLQDVTCFGDLNGAAEITNVSGGITAPYDVTWTHTTGLYDQTTINLGQGDAINNLMGGNWVVTVTDQEGCAWSHLFNIYEPAELTLDFIFNDPSCYGFNDGSVTASTSGGNGSNVFTMTNSAGTQLNVSNSNTINQLVEGWYYTTIVDSEGCNVEDSVFIDDPGEILIDLDIDQPLCYGVESGFAEVDTVYNYTGSYGNVAYFWNPNPSGTQGIGATFSNHMGPGTYSLTINDENGCSNVFDFVIAYPDSLYFTEFGTHPAHCRTQPWQSGNGVVYAAAAGGTPDYDYLWTYENTGATTTNTTWGGRNAGTYFITVTDEAGCVLTKSVELDSVSPIADFEIYSASFLTPGTYEGTGTVCVEFENQSQYFSNDQDPLTDTTFQWNFNHPTNPWITTHDYYATFDTCYTGEAEYEVCLIAINKNDCQDTLCKTIIVHDDLLFSPVNVFSPDGDGVNETFTFIHLSRAVAEFSCVIVDRWGIVMYEMDNIADEWDGTDKNGSKCTDGVYFYTYEGVSTDGTEFSGQGNVTIVNSK